MTSLNLLAAGRQLSLRINSLISCVIDTFLQAHHVHGAHVIWGEIHALYMGCKALNVAYIKRGIIQRDTPMTYDCQFQLKDVHKMPDTIFDLETSIKSLHFRIQKVLTNSEWEIYRRLYIENKDEEETAKELGFKTSEKGRKMGYKRIRQVKTIILQKAKKILRDEGVEEFHE